MALHHLCERSHGATETTIRLHYWIRVRPTRCSTTWVGRAVLAVMSPRVPAQRAALTAPERSERSLIDTQAGPRIPKRGGLHHFGTGPPLLWPQRSSTRRRDHPRQTGQARRVADNGARTADRLRQAYKTLVRREDVGPRLASLDPPAVGRRLDAATRSVSHALADGLGGKLGLPRRRHAANLTHPDRQMTIEALLATPRAYFTREFPANPKASLQQPSSREALWSRHVARFPRAA